MTSPEGIIYILIVACLPVTANFKYMHSAVDYWITVSWEGRRIILSAVLP
jgi:hypothetical protein